MAKKIVGFIKLQVPAGKANPSPPIGPALGQRGLNIMEFCKAFNAQTQKVEPGLPLPVVITAFADKSFTFIMKTPPATVLIKKAARHRQGQQGAAYRQGGQADARPGRGDRQGQDARSDRVGPGRSRAHHRRQRALHGRDRGGREMNQVAAKLSKRQKATAKVDRNKAYPALDAMKLMKQAATAKFDESVDVAVNLGIDAKKSDQTVRGSVVLPAGTGKTSARRGVRAGRQGRRGQGCRRRHRRHGRSGRADQGRQDGLRRASSPAPTPCASSASWARYWVRAA